MAGYGAVIWQVVIALGSIAYSMSQKPDIDREDKGVNVTKRGAQNPKSVMYGRAFIPGTCIYTNIRDDKSNVMLNVFDLGIGKSTYIHQLYIDDKPVLFGDHNIVTDPNKPNDGFFGNKPYQISGSNVVYNGQLTDDFADQCIVQFRNGSDSERALEMAIQESDGEWTTSHRGDNVTQVAVRSLRITDGSAVIVSERYKLVADVSGVAVYDPRTGNTQWTDNASCCILDYLLNSEYGLGIPNEYIDMDSFANMANFCDANGLKINGWVNTGETYGKVLEQLLSSCDGSLVIENGKLRLKIITQGVSKHSFDESNIIGALNLTDNSGSNYYNCVKVKYRSYQNKYEQDTYVLPKNQQTDPTIQRDGYIKTRSLDMPFSVDGFENNPLDGTVNVNGSVKWMANRLYMRSKYQQQVQLSCDLLKYPLLINDIITVNHPLYTLTTNDFIVTSVSVSLEQQNFGVATIKALAYHPDLFLSNIDGWTGKPTRPIEPLSPPSGLQFITSATDGLSYFGKLTWDSSFYSNTRSFDIEYKLSSRTDWTYLGNTKQREYLINGLSPDRYDFRVRTLDVYRGSSKWTTLTNVQIASTITLPHVRGVTATSATNSIDFSIKWDDMSDYDCQTVDPSSPNKPITGKVKDVFKHYRVDVFHLQNGSWVLKNNYTTTGTNFNYSFGENQKNGLNRNIRMVVYIVSKTGVVSPYNAVSGLSLNNPQMGLTQINDSIGEFGTWKINWSISTGNDDYKATQIHVGTSSNFTPSGATLYTEIAGTQLVYQLPDGIDSQYIKIGSYDVFGTDGMVFSNSINVTRTSIDDYLPDLSDQLSDLNKPEESVTDTGQHTIIVASPNKRNTTGIGLWAADDGTSDVILSGDRIMFATGGRAEWSSSLAYSVGHIVSMGVYPNRKLYRCIRAHTNVMPPNTTYWALYSNNPDQAAFYLDSADQKMYIRNAMIQDLTTENILTNSLTGNEFTAVLRITAGQGHNIVAMSGNGDASGTKYRLWAGNSLAASAPFSVTQDGTLTATKANITGSINATSGSFTGSINATSGSFTGTVNSQNADIKGKLVATSGELQNVVIRENCTILGTLDVANLTGDVVKILEFDVSQMSGIRGKTQVGTVSIPYDKYQRWLRIDGLSMYGFGTGYIYFNVSGISETQRSFKIADKYASVGTVQYPIFSGTTSPGHLVQLPAGYSGSLSVSLECPGTGKQIDQLYQQNVSCQLWLRK
ncbi:phage tail tip protein [Shewanella sp. SE1]|uniref:phage tail tip protein n=1 Tax=Shewanella sp. SE1 TaxID=2705014 RepID=UPI00138F89B7|nr:hypothetical protein [Shewanella sp. SE1]NDO73084.1 hypothetical protein [Shewanella sp. SE1]